VTSLFFAKRKGGKEEISYRQYKDRGSGCLVRAAKKEKEEFYFR
jgi:hypothetical protein